MSSEMSTRFDFRDVENKWLKYWEDNHIFHGETNADKKPYSIVIPPPNVTGILHMGHALNNTLQDIIIRFKRMQGFETCWMPGTDHAGIATQNVVEKKLAKEGKTRYDVGREELLKELWAWKKEYGDTIINQLKKIGSSCDWDRTRFTMDEHYSNVVRHVFVSLYEKNLIYKGEYIINWCPRCQTALSDEEAEHHNHQGALYHICYPFKNDPKQFITVATTRPETMLGDTAVAVNPNDPRYTDVIGKILVLPILNREIPIIADEFVDPEFGTGAVKVTPAHDPNDFAMGQRHNLDAVNVMHPDGRMNNNAGDNFTGMDRFEAREAIIEMLRELKVLKNIEEHHHAVGHCYRCHTVVEPYLSNQWFVKMAPLAKPALDVVNSGKITFYPEHWTKVYCNWLENIRDWCISRQIWWGHRIPVWYCQQCGEIIVSREDITDCPKCSSTNLRQDEDVLDTWFSSWLWPFATFGWPEEKKDIDFFYPTNSLFTASEIIFFWVARMIMAGLEFIGDIPFSDVLIHGTVRDTQGRKMSKSLGNAIDPLEIIQEYGADALRFSLIINSGQDIYISKDKFEIGRNFANKIWNASRLVLMNTQLKDRQIDLTKDSSLKILDLPSKWIISKFQRTLSNVNKALDEYRFSEAENLIYDFFWANYCDWYLEIIKKDFNKDSVQKVAFSILEQSIRMMHPFVPFVTEEIWKHLKISSTCLAQENWPATSDHLNNPTAEAEMEHIINLVSNIRNCRIQWGITPHQAIDITITTRNTALRKSIEAAQEILKSLIKINSIIFVDEINNVKEMASGVAGEIKYFIALQGMVDVAKEKQRMVDEIAATKKATDGIKKRLANKKFLEKAPEDVVKKDQQRLTEFQLKINNLEEVINNLI